MALSPPSELACNWLNLGFSRCIFDTPRGRPTCRLRRHMLMCWQKAPRVKGKIQSTLSWLGRLKVEGNAVGDGGEPKRRKILFEYISFIDHERVGMILTLNPSGLLKGLRTCYSPYLSVPVPLDTRKMMKTWRLYAGSRRTSGTPS